jgi:hypothetical protein
MNKRDAESISQRMLAELSFSVRLCKHGDVPKTILHYGKACACREILGGMPTSVYLDYAKRYCERYGVEYKEWSKKVMI